MTFTVSFENLKNDGSFSKDLPSRIPSLPGEKLFTSSVMATPRSLCFNAPESFKPSPIIITLLPLSCSEWI